MQHVRVFSLTGLVYCAACGATVAAPLSDHRAHCRPPAECPPLAPEEHIERGTGNNSSNSVPYGSVGAAITADVSSTAMPVDVSALKRPFFFNPNGGITLKSTSGEPVIIFVRTDPSSGSVR